MSVVIKCDAGKVASPQIQAFGFVVILLWHVNPGPRGCFTAKLVLRDVMWDLRNKPLVSEVLHLLDLDMGQDACLKKSFLYF